jgi:crotonobetainyl-CoA:carnitine CoA-transferase CaiB-like acyl-CoA transferase
MGRKTMNPPQRLPLSGLTVVSLEQAIAAPLTSFLPAITIPGVAPVMGDIPAVGAHTEAILAELGIQKAPKP